MSAATEKRPSERLEEVRGRVREAEARVAALDLESRQAQRALDAALAPLRGYFEDVGAGDRDPDPDEEARLRDQVRDAEAVITFKPSPDGQTLQATDERVEAMLAGARRALEERQHEFTEFLRADFEPLAAEIAAAGQVARDRLQAALEETIAARAAYVEVRRAWRPICEPIGVPADLPADPLRGLTDELPAGGIPLPIPTSINPTTQEDRPTP